MWAVKLCWNKILEFLTHFDYVVAVKMAVFVLLFCRTKLTFCCCYFWTKHGWELLLELILFFCHCICLTDHVLDFVVLTLQTAVPDLLLSSQILEARVKFYLQFWNFFGIWRMSEVSHIVTLFMVALCNRADHYIFILFLLLLLFFPRLISAVGNWMFTILWHMMWP